MSIRTRLARLDGRTIWAPQKPGWTPSKWSSLAYFFGVALVGVVVVAAGLIVGG